MLDLFGFGKRSLLERWADRAQGAADTATQSLEDAADRLADAAREVRERGGERLDETRKKALAASDVGREALADRLGRLTRRAAEIREQRARAIRARELRRRQAARLASPIRMDVSDADRITLRGRRPVDLRMPDGSVVRYRYHERPGFLRRLYWRLTGRRIWPR